MQFDVPERYVGSDFVIRAYQLRDVDLLRTAVRSSYDHLIEFLPWPSLDEDRLTSETTLRRIIANYTNKVDFTLGIFSPDETELWGGTGFHPRGKGLDEPACEIGMWIAAAQAGSGLGTRVLESMLSWGFNDWPWRRLEWRCDAKNLASARVAIKNNLRHEGLLESECLDHHGRWRDTHIYAMAKYSRRHLEEPYTVKAIPESDCLALGRIHADSWHDTYSQLMSPEKLRGLTGRSSAENWSQYFKNPSADSSLLGIYNASQRLLGMCSIGPAREDVAQIKAELYAINLPQIYQGQGLGKLLFAAAQKTLKDAGHNEFYLWCLESNQTALNFYKGLGGVICQSKKDEYGKNLAFRFSTKSEEK